LFWGRAPQAAGTEAAARTVEAAERTGAAVYEIILTGFIAAAFAATHLFGARLGFLTRTPRSLWLSFAGGVSVAYVFVHLLPELAEHQRTFRAEFGGSGIETHSYLVALAGLAAFYGLDRLARQSARSEASAGRERHATAGVFWIHVGSFAAYNLLIGYLLLHREESGLRELAVYAVAMGLHFIVNDQGLREQHGRSYDAQARWLLAAAPPAGWAIGIGVAVSPLLLAGLFAFLAGGIVLNVLKEELPEDRESRFGAFAVGTGGYAALLLLT
jgi:hypothetical protein